MLYTPNNVTSHQDIKRNKQQLHWKIVNSQNHAADNDSCCVWDKKNERKTQTHFGKTTSVAFIPQTCGIFRKEREELEIRWSIFGLANAIWLHLSTWQLVQFLSWRLPCVLSFVVKCQLQILLPQREAKQRAQQWIEHASAACSKIHACPCKAQMRFLLRRLHEETGDEILRHVGDFVKGRRLQVDLGARDFVECFQLVRAFERGEAT